MTAHWTNGWMCLGGGMQSIRPTTGVRPLLISLVLEEEGGEETWCVGRW